MKLITHTIQQSLNKAYFKLPVQFEQIEILKSNLTNLTERVDERQSEEYLKNVIAEFLKDTYYKDSNYINVNDRKDLVIHNGKHKGYCWSYNRSKKAQ